MIKSVSLPLHPFLAWVKTGKTDQPSNAASGLNALGAIVGWALTVAVTYEVTCVDTIVVCVSVVSVGVFLNVMRTSLKMVDGSTVSCTTGRDVTVNDGCRWPRGLKAAGCWCWGSCGS